MTQKKEHSTILCKLVSWDNFFLLRFWSKHLLLVPQSLVYIYNGHFGQSEQLLEESHLLIYNISLKISQKEGLYKRSHKTHTHRFLLRPSFGGEHFIFPEFYKIQLHLLLWWSFVHLGRIKQNTWNYIFFVFSGPICH